MKKFSKVTGEKVNSEPKIENKATDENLFRFRIMSLMENLLTIRTYGPIDKYLNAGSIQISGKEMLVEALLDLFSNKSLKDQVKLLEGLKSQSSDWKSIDGKIDNVNDKINESLTKSKMINHRQKLINLYKIYKNDEDMFIKQIEDSANKIKTGNTAFWRGLTSEHIAAEGKFPKNIFRKASDIYYFRAKQLGYQHK